MRPRKERERREACQRERERERERERLSNHERLCWGKFETEREEKAPKGTEGRKKWKRRKM